MKRSNGTGNITKLPGNRRKPWAVRISAWDNGRRYRKILGTFKTRKEAQEQINRLVVLAEFDASPVKKVSLEECLNEAIERSEEMRKPSSVRQYRSAMKHLDPLLHLPVQAVTGEKIQAIVDNLCASGLSYPFVVTIVSVLRKGIKVALRKGIITTDPTAGVEFGSSRFKKPKEKTAFTHSEISEMWQRRSVWDDTILMMIYTGMRYQEFIDITPADYKNGCLYVNDSKTASGIRFIPVADCIKPIVEERLANGHLLHFFGSRSTIRRGFKDEFDKRSHTPHETRHTFATLLDEARLPGGHRIDIVVAKVLLGHRVSDLTKGTYTHENYARLVEAVNALQTVF